jgi:mRNA interferase RelE/StbE
MLTLKLSKQAEIFLDTIPIKHAKQIVGKIDKLIEDPNSVQSKQLEGFPQYRRVKSGEYRIIYRVDNGILTLLVVLIGKRNDGQVYKDFVKSIS